VKHHPNRLSCFSFAVLVGLALLPTLSLADPPSNLTLPSFSSARPSNAPSVAPSPVASEILLLFDASGSMNEPAGRDADEAVTGPPLTKLQAGKRAIQQWLVTLPPDTRVGLRVYGNAHGSNALTPCRASRLVVPIAPANISRLGQAINQVQAAGPTPISYSLEQAANFDFSPGNHKKTLLLVTDGLETCDVDPCSIVLDLAKRHPNLRINVIAFGNFDANAMQQLGCLAKSTFGQVSQAKTAAQLLNQLQQGTAASLQVQGQVLLPSSNAPVVPTPRPYQPTMPAKPSSLKPIDFKRL
jgi:Ca-activated chloride channel family protein